MVVESNVLTAWRILDFLFIPSETIQEFFAQPSHRALSLAVRCLKNENANDDSNVSLASSTWEMREMGTGHRIDDGAIGKGRAIQLGKNTIVSG